MDHSVGAEDGDAPPLPPAVDVELEEQMVRKVSNTNLEELLDAVNAALGDDDEDEGSDSGQNDEDSDTEEEDGPVRQAPAPPPPQRPDRPPRKPTSSTPVSPEKPRRSQDERARSIPPIVAISVSTPTSPRGSPISPRFTKGTPLSPRSDGSAPRIGARDGSSPSPRSDVPRVGSGRFSMLPPPPQPLVDDEETSQKECQEDEILLRQKRTTDLLTAENLKKNRRRSRTIDGSGMPSSCSTLDKSAPADQRTAPPAPPRTNRPKSGTASSTPVLREAKSPPPPVAPRRRPGGAERAKRLSAAPEEKRKMLNQVSELGRISSIQVPVDDHSLLTPFEVKASRRRSKSFNHGKLKLDPETGEAVEEKVPASVSSSSTATPPSTSQAPKRNRRQPTGTPQQPQQGRNQVEPASSAPSIDDITDGTEMAWKKPALGNLPPELAAALAGLDNSSPGTSPASSCDLSTSQSSHVSASSSGGEGGFKNNLEKLLVSKPSGGSASPVSHPENGADTGSVDSKTRSKGTEKEKERSKRRILRHATDTISKAKAKAGLNLEDETPVQREPTQGGTTSQAPLRKFARKRELSRYGTVGASAAAAGGAVGAGGALSQEDKSGGGIGGAGGGGGGLRKFAKKREQSRYGTLAGASSEEYLTSEPKKGDQMTRSGNYGGMNADKQPAYAFGFDPTDIAQKAKQKAKVQRSPSLQALSNLAKHPCYNIIKEIVETEEDYVHDLHVLKDLYKQSLLDERVLPQDKVDQIFGNLERIIEINESFLDELHSEIAKAITEIEIGKCFTSLSEHLADYSDFCSVQHRAIHIISELEQKSRPFATFLMYCQSQPETRQLNLPSFLIKPVQRVCKYPLLLRELMKATPNDHPDQKYQQEAMDRISDAVAIINEKKRELERIQRLIDLGKKWGLQLHSGRRVVHEGAIYRLDKKKKVDGYFYLFEDLFIFFKPDTGSLKAKIPLDDCKITDPKRKDHPLAFELSKSNGKEKIVLLPDSAETKAQLTESVNVLCVQAYNSLKAHQSNATRRLDADTSAVLQDEADQISFTCHYGDEEAFIFLASETACRSGLLNSCARTFRITHPEHIVLSWKNSVGKQMPIASEADFQQFLPLMNDVYITMADTS